MKYIQTYNDFVNESLSKAGLQKMITYLKNDALLNDEDVDAYISLLSKNAKLTSNQSSINYNDYFLKHDLSQKAQTEILNMFAKSDKFDILNEIVLSNGLYDIDELGGDILTGNFYSDYCKGWETEAIEIAKMKDTSYILKKSTSIGGFEILLRFILKNIDLNRSKGDVNLTTGEMEVKAKITKGGHPVGNGYDIKRPVEICRFIDENLFKQDFQNIAYFAVQDKTGIKTFNEKLISSGLIKHKKEVADCIVDAVCYQYQNFSPTSDLYKAAESYYNSILSSNGLNAKDVMNLIGCMQIYMYAQIEQYKYLFIADANNGKYVCIKNCQSGILSNFDVVSSYIVFSPISFGSSYPQDWTVSITPKK